ncbi:MAG: ABC-2 family transporter protein [Clostridia bacterium]|nr:ABC-2 family transporter protein [Clostridia bacterium]
MNMKPYLSSFRLRAVLETTYRGAALGGLVTQAFFGLVLVLLYQALYAAGAPQSIPLQDMITYVWLQQMFFRALLSTDGELNEQVMSGSIVYALCRPVDQYAWWLSRSLAQKLVGSLMRLAPMIAIQFILPAELRMSLPESPAAAMQALFSFAVGYLVLSEVDTIRSGLVMRTLDNRGASAMLQLVMMFLAGNIVPLPFFPDRVQAIIRYQPFAQALDAPIRMYLRAQPAGEWLLNTAVQLLWAAALMLAGRMLWRANLRRVTVQGG